jgi:peptide/nickel transport system substrate-binding protein
VVDGSVWVANEAEGTLSRIEPGQTPDQTSVRTLVIGSVPQGLAGVNGDLWVSVRGTATSHRGGTLQMVSETRPESIDTTLAYADPSSFRVLHLLGDGLVAFEPIGGTTPAVVPDLATSLGTISPDGRTYTFELRPGIRYSNGEVVAPDDFRRALERGFRLDYLPHEILYSTLTGADACVTAPQACDLSQGITTDDQAGMITFHLVEPDPEFLYKLTMPFAYPLPASISDSEGARARRGIPGTGPYMLEAPMTRKVLTLVRNRQFDAGTARRVRGPDRMEVRAQAGCTGRGRGGRRRGRRA